MFDVKKRAPGATNAVCIRLSNSDVEVWEEAKGRLEARLGHGASNNLFVSKMLKEFVKSLEA